MDNDLSSPERPSIKVTYLDRKKRKRRITETTEDLPNMNLAQEINRALSPNMEVSSQNASASRGPKKIEIDLPGPTPKRVRRDSNESAKTTASMTKKTSHVRSASSISSLSRVMHQATASPTSSPKQKPASTSGTSAKPPSSRRAGTPDSEVDDNASIAESTISVTGKRRLEWERLEYFKNQPECGILEPHRAECTRCGKFVALGRARPYTVRPWEIHKGKCASNIPAPPPEDPDEGSEENNPASHRDPTTHTLEEESKASLESDPYAIAIKPHEVSCRKCDKTIQLSLKQGYLLTNWQNHRISCHNVMPSDRVEAAARRLTLVNDSQAESFSSHHVLCALCQKNINLVGGGEFNLKKWEEHKVLCSRTTPTAPFIESTTSPIDVSTISSPNRPPCSTTSIATESTLVLIEPSQPSDSSGTRVFKRIREDEEPDVPIDDSDARPSNRPRTEMYKSSDKEMPSSPSWFMLPFKAFVRGFRDSLKRS